MGILWLLLTVLHTTKIQFAKRWPIWEFIDLNCQIPRQDTRVILQTLRLITVIGIMWAEHVCRKMLSFNK